MTADRYWTKHLYRGIAAGLLLVALAGCQMAMPGQQNEPAAPASLPEPGGPVVSGLSEEPITSSTLTDPAGISPLNDAMPQGGGTQQVQTYTQPDTPASDGSSGTGSATAPLSLTPEMAAAQKTCEAGGGRFARRSSGSKVWACFTTPKDAGKACTTSADCSTSCLARSHTCAPIQPLFGCHDIITDAGVKMSQCLN